MNKYTWESIFQYVKSMYRYRYIYSHDTIGCADGCEIFEGGIYVVMIYLSNVGGTKVLET